MIRVGLYAEFDTDVGGQYQYALTIADALRQHPDTLEIVCYSSRKVWRTYCKKHNITFRPFPGTFAMNRYARYLLHKQLATPTPALWVARLLNKMVSRDGLDLCLFPMPTTLTAQLVIPTITAIHDLMYHYEPDASDASDFDPAWYNRLYTEILSGATTVLADSQTGIKHIRETFGDTAFSSSNPIKARLAPLPFIAPPYVGEYVQHSRLDPDFGQQHVRQAIRAIVSAADSEPYLYYPAAHRRQKNHLRLIKALQLLAEEGIHPRLVLSGPVGPATDEITGLIKNSNLGRNIVMLPYVSNFELCYLMEHARALVMPTLYGPTNIPPLEAFELGCPVLISDIYGHEEQMAGAALLFDPKNIDAIAQAIRQVWTHSSVRFELMAKGRERARQLSPDAFSRALLAIIQGTVIQDVTHKAPVFDTARKDHS